MSIEKRTVTPARRAANRAAAAHSTGPRTEAGKQRSAANAFQHGLYLTEPSVLRQALSAAGFDADAYERLRQTLTTEWQPQDTRQSLLVDDLARLYWLKQLHQRAHLEWQARHARHYRLAQARRHQLDERNQRSASDVGSGPEGWHYQEPSSAKFEGLTLQWDRLEAMLAAPGWEENDVREALTRIFHHRLNRAGRRLRILFQKGAELEGVAREECVNELRALIRCERAGAAEEQRLWEQARQLEAEAPLDSDDPALQPLSENWAEILRREERLDRQINTKIRLLLRLQTPPRSPRQAAGATEDRSADLLGRSAVFHWEEGEVAQSVPSSDTLRRCPDNWAKAKMNNNSTRLPIQKSKSEIHNCGDPTAGSAGRLGSENIEIQGTKPNHPSESTLPASRSGRSPDSQAALHEELR